MTLHGQHVLLSRDCHLLGFETRERERNPIVVLAGAFDVGGEWFSSVQRVDSSSRLKSRSKPTVDRHSGVKSKVLIATSSFKQHGYESVGHHVRRPYAGPRAGAPGATPPRGGQRIRCASGVVKN